MFSICACGRSELKEEVQISIESSSVYEKEEIQSAIDIVMAYFDSNFIGCTMTEISYEEDFSVKQSAEWASQYEEDEAIVLTSFFYTDSRSAANGFSPNADYGGWMWILTRSDGGNWTLRTWGY